MRADVRHAAATDIGLSRETNEDGYLTEPPLFAVADGMGGHMAGDVASRVALEVLSRGVGLDPGALAEAVKDANREVHQQAVASPELKGMGTTITAMVARPERADIAHVGDSRAYLYRGEVLTRLTRDHTVVERMVREGRIDREEAEHHPQRSYLERALGVEPEVEVDSYNIATQPGDRILLCTDGLTGMLNEDEIRDILQSERDPEQASKRLVSAAVEAGGSDNVTVVVVDYPGADPVERATVAVPQTAAEAPPRVRGRRRLTITALVVAGILAALVATKAAALSRWYVGEDRGRVAIFRGVPGFLHKLEKRTEIPTETLPAVYRNELEEGIVAENRDEAGEIVSDLKDIQAQHGAPKSGSSPYPNEPAP